MIKRKYSCINCQRWIFSASLSSNSEVEIMCKNKYRGDDGKTRRCKTLNKVKT